MARQLETLVGICDLCAVNLEDGNVLVEIIADQQILSVRREHRPSRQSADLDVANPANLLVDAQHRDATIATNSVALVADSIEVAAARTSAPPYPRAGGWPGTVRLRPRQYDTADPVEAFHRVALRAPPSPPPVAARLSAPRTRMMASISAL